MLAHVCQKYMFFKATVSECIIFAPKTRAIISGNIANGSTVKLCLSCFTYNAVPSCGPEAKRCIECILTVYFNKVTKVNSSMFKWGKLQIGVVFVDQHREFGTVFYLPLCQSILFITCSLTRCNIFSLAMIYQHYTADIISHILKFHALLKIIFHFLQVNPVSTE